jgi:hypothetical protein
MMNDFEDTLRSRWPELYDEAFDLSVGPGWHTIIFTLSDAIQGRIDFIKKQYQWYINRGDKPNFDLVEPVKVTQVKEKFGGLRFYYDGGDVYIAGLVLMAEQWAIHTCEECGQRGHNRTDLSWHKTLCDVHYDERKNK